MNRSRIIAAGTSVGALVAITAGVAAANPAPSTSAAHRTVGRATPPPTQVPAPVDPGFSSDDRGSDEWQQLPPDTSASGPATDLGPGPVPNQVPTFDPNAGGNLGGSNTSSGGS